MFDRSAPRLRTRLSTGAPLGAHWFSLGSAALVELSARTRPDCVILDVQHGLWERLSLEAAVGACPPDVPCLVRVEDDAPASLARGFDCGAEGVIVPMVESAAQAAAAASNCRYPPRGRRSAGGIRPFVDFPSYMAAAEAAICVGVMIETADGLDAAEEIAAVAEVDFVFVGPGDLNLSLGRDPERFEAGLARILAACAAAGKPCGMFTNDLDAAKRRAAQGFGMVTTSTDVIDADVYFRRASEGWRA